jgi:hypothetical protein
MIRLDFLAYRFNEMLGLDKYAVFLNSNAFPDDIGDRNVVTMSALRVPFGFSQDELDAESMTITLTFDLPCDAYGDEVYLRDNALAHIQNTLLGHQTFMVEYDTEHIYEVNTYLEMQPPSNPYVDAGRITQQIVVSGSALVKAITCGAIVGNNIKVFIDGKQLLKVDRTSAMQVGADNNIPLSEGKVVPEMLAISKVCTKAVSFLYTGNDIEKEFIKIAEGYPFDINKVYTYKAVYGSFSTSVKVKIASVSTQDSTGTFLQYTLNLQIVDDAEVV